MIDFISAVVAAFGVVFVAELGDKTQLIALGYGAQYSLRIVAIGLVLGYGAANLLATIVGGLLGAGAAGTPDPDRQRPAVPRLRSARPAP